MNQKDEIISELKSEIESKTEDFTKLENQVEQLGKLLTSSIEISTLFYLKHCNIIPVDCSPDPYFSFEVFV